MKDFAGYLENYVKPQVAELLTNYGPIGLIWFDTPKGISAEQSRSLLEFCRQLQPDCLVSGRLGNALGDYASAGDNRIPGQFVDADREMPATINDTWGFKANDHNWKSTEELIRKLADIVSKGGNYLLNVGPTALGDIPAPSVQRLQEIGRWLEVNGEAIYGTRPGPIQNETWCRSTRRVDRVDLHVFDWPAGGRLALPEMPVAAAWLLSDAEHRPLTVSHADGAVVIQGPISAPDATDTVVALELVA